MTRKDTFTTETLPYLKRLAELGGVEIIYGADGEPSLFRATKDVLRAAWVIEHEDGTENSAAMKFITDRLNR